MVVIKYGTLDLQALSEQWNFKIHSGINDDGKASVSNTVVNLKTQK